MLAWQRNLLVVLGAVAAVLVSVASVVVIVVEVSDEDDGDDEAAGRRFELTIPDDLRGRFEALPAAGPLLGVSLEQRDGALAVIEVVPDSPAARAGVRVGDVLLRVNDTAVPDIAALRRAVSALAPGSTYDLRVRRDNNEQTLKVERPAAQGFAMPQDRRFRLDPPLQRPGVPGAPSLDDPELRRLFDELQNALRRYREQQRPAPPLATPTPRT